MQGICAWLQHACNEPSQRRSLEVLADLPCVLLQHSSIYPVLLGLTDFSSLPMVRANAKQLLDCLPTYNQVLTDLTAALQGSDPAAEMQRLLHVQQPSEPVSSTPGQLLYTLQVILLSLRCCSDVPATTIAAAVIVLVHSVGGDLKNSKL